MVPRGDAAQATSDEAETKDPTGALQATLAQEALYRPPAGVATTSLGPQAVDATTGGGGQSHNNVMPFLCVNFIVALVGIYPSRQ